MAARPVPWTCCVLATILVPLLLPGVASATRVDESDPAATAKATLWTTTKDYLDHGYQYLRFLERCRLRGRMESPQATYLGILLACPVGRGEGPRPSLPPPVTWAAIEPLLAALATRDNVAAARLDGLRREVGHIAASMKGVRGDIRLIFCGHEGPTAPDLHGCLSEDPRPIMGSLIHHFKLPEPTIATRILQPTLEKLIYPVATGILSSILVVMVTPARKK